MAIRNQALTVNFTVWDTDADTGRAGDAANLTMRLIKDGATPGTLTNTPTEADPTNMPGVYQLVLTATEMDADFVALGGKSSTAQVVVIPTYIHTESGDLAAIAGNVSSVLTDTNELQTDWQNGGRLDLILDDILTDTNELQGDWVDAGRLDAILDSILADTNELQGDWVDGGRLDLILDDILTDTSTGVTVSAAAIAAIADAVLDEAIAAHNTAGTVGAFFNSLIQNIWEYVIEPNAPVNQRKAVELVRIIAAFAAGKDATFATGTDWAVYGLDGTTPRISAALTAAGLRSSVTLDGSA